MLALGDGTCDSGMTKAQKGSRVKSDIHGDNPVSYLRGLENPLSRNQDYGNHREDPQSGVCKLFAVRRTVDCGLCWTLDKAVWSELHSYSSAKDTM